MLWEKILTLEKFQKKNTLPETPGVYFFLGAKRELLYIGKAASLRDRVKSYFSRDIRETRGPKIGLMLERVCLIAYTKTDSVLEALILETRLIKKHQSPYNTDSKDDKSFNYVVITQEKFPRVLTKRGRDILSDSPASKIGEYKKIFGPFTSGGSLREALKIIRKIFPFRDKCVPEVGKLCFSAQIGLCPGVCAGKISARDYRKIISRIVMFFEGQKTALVKKLKREMKTAAKNLEFEQADQIKKTLFALKHIQDIALLKDEWGMMNYESGIANQEFEKSQIRIEAYDVAHLGGDASVGVMVTVQNEAPLKEFYRKFILRKKHRGNDLMSLQEILERRLKHTEWSWPDMIVIDGAEPQVNTAKSVLAISGLTIPIIGVVKNSKHRPERFIGEAALIKRFEKAILLANSEAHRFAISFHRHRRRREFL